jgi:hypothetical protein
LVIDGEFKEAFMTSIWEPGRDEKGCIKEQGDPLFVFHDGGGGSMHRQVIELEGDLELGELEVAVCFEGDIDGRHIAGVSINAPHVL